VPFGLMFSFISYYPGPGATDESLRLCSVSLKVGVDTFLIVERLNLPVSLMNLGILSE
jgi:hypothetical protein